MSKFWPDKSPDDVLDYQVDWTEALDGDTIATSTWSVPAGITKDSDSSGDSTTTIWLSGGTADQEYEIENTIVTVANRTFKQCVTIRVVECP